MRFAAVTLLALTALACQAPEREDAVWFVHATDPHLFEEEVRLAQEEANRKAFLDALEAMKSLPGTGVRPAFLVITGDFGIGEKVPEQGGDRVDRLARMLRTSPVRNVYLVPGNNDIVQEEATGEALAASVAFFEQVQEKLGNQMIVHDLSSCYLGVSPSLAGCYADVPGTSFRLVGFPSYSFKATTETPPNAKRQIQNRQMERFARLVRLAEAQRRKVLVVSHIAELNDPYIQARDQFAGDKRYDATNPARPAWSAWDVSLSTFAAWKDLVNSGTVAGVLAGHFHDSHREIYARPYRWAPTSLARADPGKVYLAPPLALKLQDASPIQARGFSLIGLQGEHMTRRLYWYDAVRSSFLPEPAARPKGRFWPDAAVSWLWRLGTENEGMSGKEQLARATLAAIAFIAALLTVVALWEIPPAKPATSDPAPPAGKNDGKTSSPPAGNALGGLTSAFQGNFARTVASGLGGMAAVSFIEDSFWKDSGVSPKSQYLVYFAVLFLAILLISSLYQAGVEALRSRIVLAQRPPSWPPRPKWASQKAGAVPLAQTVIHLWHRFWRWVLSLRSTLLIFLDTLFNVVQGKNQTKTAIFGQDIINLHWSIYWTVEQVRKSIDDTLRRLVKTDHDSDIRVNISILSDDNASVTYLAWERGSLGKPFNQRSVGWVSVYTGEARWVKVGKDWNETYAGNRDAILFKNESSMIPGETGPLHLFDHYQARETPDYEAFIILPVPWSRRSETRQYRRAGIHISFRKAEDLASLWDGLETRETIGGGEKLKPNYDAWKDLLDCDQDSKPPRLHLKKRELQAVLQQSMDVLGEVLRHFNTTLFEEKIRPQIKV